MTAVHSREAAALPPTDPAPHPGMTVSATVRAFGALVARDLTVLRRQPLDFFARSVVQPLMLLFALGYVTPHIAAGASGTSAGSTFAADQATTLLAGMLAMVVLFQGITAVAMPLVQEFGVTREIDDRVLSPVPVSLVACAKVAVGALQGLLAAAMAFPLAEFVPAERPALHIDWPVLLTLAPLGALLFSSLGLYLGSAFQARNVMALFATLLTPVLYLGCTLYPWSALDNVRWVQLVSLINPLTFLSEGFRASVTSADHLSLLVVYPVLIAATALLLGRGIRHFRGRVVS
ncbi:ABC transporter permease [Uniformispora flossi]|uniref:ABC transporter permease n=1 Tax=Uniformispora flossi TaxID=3390723 RepID=UPI003C30C273